VACDAVLIKEPNIRPIMRTIATVMPVAIKSSTNVKASRERRFLDRRSVIRGLFGSICA